MKVIHVVVSAAMLLSVVGCSSLGSDKLVDYGAGAKQLPSLEVPPDLTAPEKDERYKVPLADIGSVATYSDYNKVGAVLIDGSGKVLPEMKGIRMEREGTRRWLVVNRDPEKVWVVVKDFWREVGLTILSEDETAGVMETDWAENRAKIPKSPIRDMFGKVFNSVYSSNEKDQYLTRLERGKDGKSTEVYVTHRGIQQVYSEDMTSSRWLARPNEPELEAIMLQRLMVQFGASEAQASKAIADTKTEVKISTAGAPEPAGTATLREVTGGNVVIIVSDAFDRSWRRVGLAIESAELGVEDRDRQMGTYFLRPLKGQSSWSEKLKFWKQSDPVGKQYRVNVKDVGATCEVSVTDQDGLSSNITNKLTEEIYKYINQ